MGDLILTNAQAEVISQAKGPLTVKDANGRKLGQLIPAFLEGPNKIRISTREIAEIERRMALDGPWSTTEEVLQHLKAMETE